ncbi:glycosyltransferase [candidate division GN15 bacterium]|nr:glycosyltransferase [candidate division GN15 bacterium]
MSRSMNILHLRASNFYGGPERQLHFHARLAKESPYRVLVGSFTESGERPEFLGVIADDGIPTHTFQVASAYDTRAVSDIRTYCREQQVDILCTHDYRTTMLGYLAARRMGTRWIAFSRGFTQDNLKVRLYHALDKFFIRFANHVVAVSESQKVRLKRLYVRERIISVAHNAIDPASFDQIPPIDLRERFRFHPDTTVCISGGRFSREKGQRYLVDAAIIALKTHPHLRFVLFGDGPDYEAVKATVEKAGVGERIVCPGFERAFLGCIKTADMLINPSLSEGLPNIVLEAMALDTPVVATNVGGLPELVTHEQSGLLVPPADPESLAAAIIQTADNTGATAEMVRQARRTVDERFSFQAQFDTLSKLYEQYGNTHKQGRVTA